MGLETATYINELDATNPASTDFRKQGDDHLRLIKAVLQATFPRATRPFPVETYSAETADFTVQSTDDNTLFGVTAAAGAVTVTLPIDLGTDKAGFCVAVIRTDAGANTVTVQPSSGTVNGVASLTVARQYEILELEWSGTEWFALHNKSAQRTIKTVTANTTLTLDDLEKLIICTPASADITLTLPAVANCIGRRFWFKRVSASYKTTLDANSAETINNTTTYELSVNYVAVEIFATASGWMTGSSPVTNATAAQITAGTAVDVVVTPGRLCDALWAKVAEASAATLTLGAGGYFTVSGTAGITAITFSQVVPGRRVFLKFTDPDGLKITASSTLITPSGDDLYMSEDDIVEVLCDTVLNTRIVSVIRTNSDFRVPDVIIEDQKTSTAGVHGGSFAQATDVTRALNTLVCNVGTLASLNTGTGRFTLPAGKYYIEWDAPAYLVDFHQTWLYDHTNTTILKQGSSEYAASNSAIQNRSHGSAYVTLTANTALAIIHRCQTTCNTTGLGRGSIGAAGFDTDVYTRVKIWRGV